MSRSGHGPRKPGAACAQSDCCGQAEPDRRRRAVLGGLAGLALSSGLLRANPADAAKKPNKMRAQVGDQLVFKTGKRKGEVITAGDVELGARPIVAYPYDPVEDVRRTGSRLNQILVLRLP